MRIQGGQINCKKTRKGQIQSLPIKARTEGTMGNYGVTGNLISIGGKTPNNQALYLKSMKKLNKTQHESVKNSHVKTPQVLFWQCKGPYGERKSTH